MLSWWFSLPSTQAVPRASAMVIVGARSTARAQAGWIHLVAGTWRTGGNMQQTGHGWQHVESFGVEVTLSALGIGVFREGIRCELLAKQSVQRSKC